MIKSSESPLRLGIDAVNIRQGGGITHLSQLLEEADPYTDGFESVTVWTSQATANNLPSRPWLFKRTAPWIEGSLPRRLLGQQLQLKRELALSNCDVLFSPGGTLPWGLRLPAVVMSQNMLPFNPSEARRFGRYSLMRLKLFFLRFMQVKSFRIAKGLIFLTRYAENEVLCCLGAFNSPSALVPHGVERRFFQTPRLQRYICSCTIEQPFRFLYVSILMPYKNQIEVAKAAARIRLKGMPIEICFVGAAYGNYVKEFQVLINSLDPQGKFLKWVGEKPFASLHKLYRESDAFVFASTCENLPNILIEAMASGLPIACSNRGPMPEVLGDAGIYFDPDSQDSIENAMQTLANDNLLRTKLAYQAWKKAQSYSWKRCAKNTFEFIAKVARQHPRGT